MAPKKGQKKSETLELRLEHDRKQAFMTACRARGLTASDAVRDFIDSYVQMPSPVSSRPWLKEMMTMTLAHKMKLAALAIGVATLAIAAQPQGSAVANDAAFTRLDADKNGKLTPGEIHSEDAMLFEVLDTNKDGAITPDEFVTNTEIVHIENIDGEDGVSMRTKSKHVFVMKVGDGERLEGAWSQEDTDAFVEKVIKEAGVEGEIAEKRRIMIIKKDDLTTTTVEE